MLKAASISGIVPLKILIIEDNADGREALRLLLTLLGCRVETAADGAEGVRMALAGRPHVAFVDIGLPLLDGYEVARRVRAALGRRILLVACTAYDEGSEGVNAKESQFDAWLVKPVELPDLLHWLRAAAALIGNAAPTPGRRT